MLLPIDINIEIETNCIIATIMNPYLNVQWKTFHPIISFSSTRNYDILYDYVPLNTSEYLIYVLLHYSHMSYENICSHMCQIIFFYLKAIFFLSPMYYF